MLGLVIFRFGLIIVSKIIDITSFVFHYLDFGIHMTTATTHLENLHALALTSSSMTKDVI